MKMANSSVVLVLIIIIIKRFVRRRNMPVDITRAPYRKKREMETSLVSERAQLSL